MGATLNRRALLGASAAFAMMKASSRLRGRAGHCWNLRWGLRGRAAGPDRQALACAEGHRRQQDIATQDPRKTKLIAERSFKRGNMDVAACRRSTPITLAQMNIWDQVTAANVPS